MNENLSITDEIKKVGQRVKEVRKSKGYSQEQLAKLCGYKGKSMISRIEQGDRNFSITKLQAIANVLNIDIDYLLSGDDMEIIVEISALEKKRNHLIDLIKVMNEEELDRLIKFLEIYH